MSEMVTEQLQRLASTLADLQGRVRRAVAGEVGRAVAEAVGDVLAAALGGQLAGLPHRPGYDPYRAGRPDAWDDPDSPGWDPGDARLRRQDGDGDSAGPPGELIVPAALAVAVTAGRWWLSRNGSPLGAAGAGLAAGTAILAGGPLAQSTVALLLALYRLLAATDALGDSADALGRA
jgi:hypothetical protein